MTLTFQNSPPPTAKSPFESLISLDDYNEGVSESICSVEDPYNSPKLIRAISLMEEDLAKHPEKYPPVKDSIWK